MPTTTWTHLPPDRRERILVAAMDEFGTHGYSTGSLNVIARQAGVAKGSLFQYFAGKLDLFTYVAEQTSLRIFEAMRPWLDGYSGAAPGTDGPRAAQDFPSYLVDAIDAWVSYFETHPLERGVTAATNMEIDPVVRQAVLEPVQHLYLAGLRPLVEEAVAAGELCADADVDALLSLLLLLLPHTALAPFFPAVAGPVALPRGDRAARRTAIERLVHPVLAGFRPARAPD
ncbi:TetR/AcrR family transcriptional regulator [Streptomyces sp. H27-S2]|uniref:TetR/AcrR family transcriptional regulator n=1 Tax=Streptomyces antarcticus TaxID=2996458 RepID=UPI0022705124|nr:TetR/AcrR family transcriptional regulator [Streptomyces sp. H27-S2]MCY0949143.1 TetR/AcrR family transcriptional regulator [Streptomyces sp. H27-S2]